MGAVSVLRPSAATGAPSMPKARSVLNLFWRNPNNLPINEGRDWITRALVIAHGLLDSQGRSFKDSIYEEVFVLFGRTSWLGQALLGHISPSMRATARHSQL